MGAVAPLLSYPGTVDRRGDDRAAIGQRADSPGTELHLLVVAVDRDSCAGVDLASGALVRAWSAEPVDPRLRPYDVVSATLAVATPGLILDPSQPESVAVVGAPSWVGRMTGRRAERYLRAVIHPAGHPLLGSHGDTVPFWERTGAGPSIGVIEPEGRTVVVRQGGSVDCRFGWRGSRMQLPMLDRRVGDALVRSGRNSAGAGRGDRLVVALTPPIASHCRKVVAGLLPRS